MTSLLSSAASMKNSRGGGCLKMSWPAQVQSSLRKQGMQVVEGAEHGGGRHGWLGQAVGQAVWAGRSACLMLKYYSRGLRHLLYVSSGSNFRDSSLPHSILPKALGKASIMECHARFIKMKKFIYYRKPSIFACHEIWQKASIFNCKL